MQLDDLDDVERRLFAAAPGARFVLARLEEEQPTGDEVTARPADLRLRRRLALGRCGNPLLTTDDKGVPVSTFDRTQTDRTTTVETPAEEADREAYDADRVEAREPQAVVDERPVSPIAAARERFGGIDLPASLVGMLTGLAMVVLLGGLVGAAVGAIGYQTVSAATTSTTSRPRAWSAASSSSSSRI